MNELLITIGIGIIIIILGIFNMKGNLSSLHWYHRHRVAENDKKVFGKFVGAGTIFCGIALIFFGVALFIAQKTQLEFFAMIGTVLLIILLTVGLGMSLYAMLKYNKGIF